VFTNANTLAAESAHSIYATSKASCVSKLVYLPTANETQRKSAHYFFVRYLLLLTFLQTCFTLVLSRFLLWKIVFSCFIKAICKIF